MKSVVYIMLAASLALAACGKSEQQTNAASTSGATPSVQQKVDDAATATGVAASKVGDAVNAAATQGAAAVQNAATDAAKAVDQTVKDVQQTVDQATQPSQ